MHQTMRLLRRLAEAIHAGWQAASRAWQTSGVIHAREHRRRLRLAAMSDRDLIRASTMWGGATVEPELRRRGLL